MEARLAKIRAKEKAQRAKYLKGDQTFKKRKTDASNDEDDEEQYVLDDYESDQESAGKGSPGGLSAATLELMSKIGMGPRSSKDDEDEIQDEIKVSEFSLVIIPAHIGRYFSALEHTPSSLNS